MTLTRWKIPRTESPIAFDVPIAGIANGVAIQSDLVESKGAAAAIVTVKATALSPTSPNSAVRVYLLRHCWDFGDDGCFDGNMLLARENAPLLGEILFSGPGTRSKSFDTSALGVLGPWWGVLIENVTGGQLSRDEGTQGATYQLLQRELELDLFDSPAPAAPTEAAIIGEVIWRASPTPPPSFLPCDGSQVSRLVYSALFNLLNATSPLLPFGAGDGSTTFHLPDLRGRAPIGAGNGGGGMTLRTIGEKVGAETVTLATSELPAHTHEYVAIETSGGSDQHALNGNEVSAPSVLSTGSGVVTSSSVGSNGAHQNMQPSLVLHAFIRYAA